MDLLTTIQELLKQPTIADVVNTAIAMGPTSSSSRAREAGVSLLRDALEGNRHKEGVATIAALMLSDPNSVISGLRRAGILRASRYDYRAACVRKVVQAAMRLSPHVGLLPAGHRYLESVVALTAIAPQARQLRRSIGRRIQPRRLLLLKTLLVMVNLAFSESWEANREISPDSLDYWTPEEIAEGFSLLVSLVRKDGGISRYTWMLTDDHIAHFLIQK